MPSLNIFISPGGNAVISYILLLFLSGNNLSSASNWASFDICSAALINSALKWHKCDKSYSNWYGILDILTFTTYKAEWYYNMGTLLFVIPFYKILSLKSGHLFFLLSRPKNCWALYNMLVHRRRKQMQSHIPKIIHCPELMRIRFTIDSDWRCMSIWIYGVWYTKSNIHLTWIVLKPNVM